MYAPVWLQEPLYMLRLDDTLAGFRARLAPRIIIDTSSLQAFYPFVSEELIHPDGILLGRNLDTGAPIVIDPYAFSNYNMVVIGESGSGKSMTAKIYIRRFRERYGYPVYIVDPEGEYSKIADVLLSGAPVVDLGGGRPAGLDPVKLARMDVIDVRQAVAVIREMYGVPKELEGELVRLAVRSTSIFEVYDGASTELKCFLEKAVSIDSWIYEGETPRGLREGVVFDLSGIRDRDTKVLAGALTASLLSALLTRKALLVVDEGWLFSQYPEVMSLLADVARRGRKRGINFLFLTQRPQDVLASEHGRTIIENAAVVLLLRLGPVALDAVRDVFRLSEAEERFLMDAEPGQGVLRAEGWRLRIYVLPTEEELRLFSTRPREVTGVEAALRRWRRWRLSSKDLVSLALSTSTVLLVVSLAASAGEVCSPLEAWGVNDTAYPEMNVTVILGLTNTLRPVSPPPWTWAPLNGTITCRVSLDPGGLEPYSARCPSSVVLAPGSGR